MRTSERVKSMVGLPSLGKSDFEAIEPFRGDGFLKEALGLAKVPCSVWMRQWLDARAAVLRGQIDEPCLRLFERTEAPITAHEGYVCAGLDTVVMDQPEGRRTPRSGGPERSEGFGAAEHNSDTDTRKEGGSRTYQGVDGYTRIALYPGNEGWNLGLELRERSQHSALETEYFFERVFPRLRWVCGAASRRCCRKSCTGQRSSSNTSVAGCWTSGAASPRM